MTEPIHIQDSLMYLDSNNTLSLVDNGYFEYETTELIKSLLKPNDIAIDIGAHIGYFTLLMASRCQRVFAFEPESSNYQVLIQNIQLNGLTNVIPSPYAVAEKAGAVTLCRNDINSGMHRIYCVDWCKGNHQMAVTVSLDQLIEKADFIKMDCEGSEYGALKGMTNLLIKNDIKMIMEFHPPSIREYGADPYDVLSFLDVLDYKITLIGYEETPLMDELIKITSDPVGGHNLFCEKKK